MAAGIQELDNVMLGSNNPAWHRQGTVIRGSATAEEAMKIARMNYTVSLEPLGISDGAGGLLESPWFATVRDDLPLNDPRRVLGCVTDRYTVIQNGELATFAQVIADAGDLAFETAGTLHNGKRAWMMAQSPNVHEIGGDRVVRYLLVSTAHNGKGCMEGMFTPVRVVCANTLNWALAGDGTGPMNKVSVRHTANKDEQIAAAKGIMEKADEYFESHRALSVSMSKTAVDERFTGAFLAALIPDPLNEDGTPVEKSKAPERRARITTLFTSEQKGSDQAGMKGTAYGLINAFTEYVDYERTCLGVQGRTADDARMNSVMFGSGARVKQNAVDLLCRSLDLAPAANDKVDELLDALDLGLKN